MMANIKATPRIRDMAQVWLTTHKIFFDCESVDVDKESSHHPLAVRIFPGEKFHLSVFSEGEEFSASF